MFLQILQISQRDVCAKDSFLIKLHACSAKKVFLEISQNSQENTRIIKKLYHTSNKMLSFLHRWDYCWDYDFLFWYRCQNRKSYHYDGEQLNFLNKIYIKTRSKMKDLSCDLYIGRNEEYQFIWQKLYSGERQMPYSTWRKST